MSLSQNEIIKLEDDRLQLRYILGGIQMSNDKCTCWGFWNCDIHCHCNPVEDDERLEKVSNFIINHNISNETFLRLTLTYLRGSFNSYKGDFGNLIPELDRTILDYKFYHSPATRFKENDLKEKQLLKLIEKSGEVPGTKLNNLLTKYSLTPVDFMILAKTSLNYEYNDGRGFEVKDLPADLRELLKKHHLYQSYEFVLKYRQEFYENLAKENMVKEQGNKSLIKRIFGK